MTNELGDHDYIVEFACLAPKSYSYLTHSRYSSTKAKGISVNHAIRDFVNLETFRNLIRIPTLDPREYSTVIQPRIARDRQSRELFNQIIYKVLRATREKRYFAHEYASVPFGFSPDLTDQRLSYFSARHYD